MKLLLYSLVVAMVANLPSKQEDRKQEELKGCGIACLYYLLLTKDSSSQLEEVEATIQERFPDADFERLSLYEVTESSKLLGIPLQSVVCDARSIQQIELPALLYVRPERLGKEADNVGHLTILTDFDSEQVRIYDPLHHQTMEFTWSEFWAGYDGELLTTSDFSSQQILNYIAWSLSILSLTGSVLLFLQWRKVRHR